MSPDDSRATPQLRSVTGAEEAVHALFNPRSVAIVGASSRPGTLSWWPMHLLQQYGFAGPIYPVNPNRDQIDGLTCIPSLAAAPGPIDAAVIALSAADTPAAVRDAAAAGVKAVVLPAQGFGEQGEAGRVAERSIIDAARAAGMRIVGPNTDGLGNLACGALMSIQPLWGQGIDLGEVAVVTQSGATAGSLVARLQAERIGCRMYASSGNEIDLGLADYLSVVIQDPGVKMVLTFIESIRKPDDFLAVAALAAELGKPIVAIKVGRTQQAAARAAAHTGALAGADAIYDAVFRATGIIRVSELSEIVAITKFFLANGAPATNRVGIMSVSGGQAGALADRAAEYGAQVPPIAEQTSAVLDELLAFGNGLNPCDLTGDVARKPELASKVYAAFDADPSIDTVIYGRKELTGNAGRDAATLLAQARTAGNTALAVYAMDGELNEDEQATYRQAGVPFFASAAELFTAIASLATYTETLARRAAAAANPAAASSGQASSGPAAALVAKPGADVLDPAATTALLAAYGIRFPREALVTSAEQAVRFADETGYPVVLKVASELIPHKTEMGGVLLGVADAQAVAHGYDLLIERAEKYLDGGKPEGVLVQEQITDGVEIIAGLVVDDSFGPFVLIGSGGILAELLKDSVLLPAPATADDVLHAIGRLRSKALLEGFRGAPPADQQALAETVAALSRLGADHADAIAELDLNPLLVRPVGRGVVAADALIVLKKPEA